MDPTSTPPPAPKAIRDERHPDTTGDQIETALLLESRPPLAIRSNSTRADMVRSVHANADAGRESILDSHGGESELQRSPQIITVKPTGQSPRRESAASLASARLSVDEIAVPGPVVYSAEIGESGTNKLARLGNGKVGVPLATTPGTDGMTDTKTETTYIKQPPAQYEHQVASQDQLQSLINRHPLPEHTAPLWVNQLRYGFFSVYRRLHALALFVNLTLIVAMVVLVVRRPDSFTYADATTAVSANLFVATMMRHEHCINALFRLALLLRPSTPVCIRRHAAKVYSYGGLHSGCGISAGLWYIFFAALVAEHFRAASSAIVDIIGITTAIMVILFVILIAMAHPTLRSRFHNQWELSHRYSGWAAIVIIWVQAALIAVSVARAEHRAVGIVLITTPSFWFLVMITGCIVYPWLHLRRRKFEAEQLSSHAVRLWFGHHTLPSCVGTRLSDRPLVETHGFATIPNPDGEKGYSVIVSNAGDWTKRLIDSPPSHLWMRGAHTIGVARISLLFRPVVMVATGSGIGPCLSFLQVHPDWPVRIIWSARFPEATYGTRVLEAVLRADPDAIIVDTKRTGHPPLVPLAYALVKDTAAEALVIISNPKVTREVVYGLETRHVPAFGAIFDS